VTLASDGIMGDWEEQLLTDEEFVEILTGNTPEEAAQRLIEKAKKIDDRTVQIIDIQ
jgi:serine/threonine protein phosphatase PrpC